MKFERPTGIPAQILKQSKTRVDIQEYNELHDHYRKLVQLEQSKKRIAESQSLSGYRFLSKSNQDFKLFARTTLIPKVQPWEVIKDSIHLNQITTLDQRLNHIVNGVNPLSMKDLQPLKVPLRIKSQKNCSICKKVLIKPDPKPTSTEFSIKSMAWWITFN